MIFEPAFVVVLTGRQPAFVLRLAWLKNHSRIDSTLQWVISIIDYLNMARIEQAKKLLEIPDRKMYTIAKAVSYDNVEYFFRVFKKLTGKTPEQYRAGLAHGA